MIALRFALFGIEIQDQELFSIINDCLRMRFLISQALFVEKETDSKIRSSAQGLFMLMTNVLVNCRW
jgi:NHS family xanthosine MFS transporter